MILKPQCAEIIDLYRRFLTANGVCLFSRHFRDELQALLGSGDFVALLEAAATLGNYGDRDDHASMRLAVSERLFQRGVRLPRGKRTDPALESMVNELVPVLLFFGVPLASSERSKLVILLRRIGEELGVKGDPRDTLRRAIKISRENTWVAYRTVIQAALDAWKL